jgi:adenylate cyclase
LLKPKLLVGRHRSCDIPLNFPTVSSRHCELEFRDGFWFVRDLDSSNGTRVNGTACSSQRLLPNDVLSMAKYRYSVIYALPADRLPPEAAGKGDPRRAPAQPAGPAARNPVAAAATLGELVPCGGGDPILLPKPQLVIGRSAGCDIVLRQPTISARHCQLEWKDGHWIIHDLGSHNGIRVEGVRCESKVLKPGDVFGIANLRYRIVYTPPGAEPPGEPSLFDRSLLEKAGLTRWKGDLSPGTPGDEDDSPHKRYTLDDKE